MNSQQGKVTSNIGINMRSGPGTNYNIIRGIPYGAAVTILGDGGNNFYKIQYGGNVGYGTKDYIQVTGSGGGGGGSSGTAIRQGDSRFNSNIRNWGCAFMSICWCGGTNSINGCNAEYNRAISNGWMRSDCYINNWDSMKGIAKAKSYRYASKGERPAGNQKEILECHHSRGTHFVVGNGNGGITYDPAYAGSVAVSQCASKRFYTY